MLSSPNADLIRLLKRLKLGQMIETLSDRLTLARAQQLDYASFLEILLADEVARRDRHRLERRIRQAGFREACRLEDFDWSAQITLDRRTLQEVFRLEFL